MQMDLLELLQHLQEVYDEKGTMPVFVNGEHGANEPEMCTTDSIQVGEANYTYGGCCTDSSDELPHGIRQRDTIMQIGGY